jgi:hypothetical protein
MACRIAFSHPHARQWQCGIAAAVPDSVVSAAGVEMAETSTMSRGDRCVHWDSFYIIFGFQGLPGFLAGQLMMSLQ